MLIERRDWPVKVRFTTTQISFKALNNWLLLTGRCSNECSCKEGKWFWMFEATARNACLTLLQFSKKCKLDGMCWILFIYLSRKGPIKGWLERGGPWKKSRRWLDKPSVYLSSDQSDVLLSVDPGSNISWPPINRRGDAMVNCNIPWCLTPKQK